VQLEDAEEEGPEVVEHLDEEVPGEPDVGRQVRDGESAQWSEWLWYSESAHMAQYALRKVHDPSQALRESAVPVRYARNATVARAVICNVEMRRDSFASKRSGGSNSAGYRLRAVAVARASMLGRMCPLREV
jgi:hypothetical protein